MVLENSYFSISKNYTKLKKISGMTKTPANVNILKFSVAGVFVILLLFKTFS